MILGHVSHVSVDTQSQIDANMMAHSKYLPKQISFTSVRNEWKMKVRLADRGTFQRAFDVAHSLSHDIRMGRYSVI